MSPRSTDRPKAPGPLLRVVLAAGLLLTLVYTVPPAPTAGSKNGGKQTASTGNRAYDFELRDINPESPTYGEVVRLSNQYAERGLVLNFIASWCAPCREELPHLQEIDASGRARVVCVAADEYGGAEGLVPLIKSTGLTVPVLFAPEPTAAVLAGHYDYTFLPATYLIDSSGAVRISYQGMLKKETLISAIDKHLTHSE